jgi:hypothetical protein
MNGQNPITMPLADFIRVVLLNDLRRMVYEAKLHYLAFGTIAVGVEFLGACDDRHPFQQSGLSESRFNLGIQRLSRSDSRYGQYNQRSSPYCLYRFLRCGTAHVMRPAGAVLFSQRSHWAQRPGSHLAEFNGQLLLICEDFYDHLARGCETLIEDLPRMTAPKLQNPYLCVGGVA